MGEITTISSLLLFSSFVRFLINANSLLNHIFHFILFFFIVQLLNCSRIILCCVSFPDASLIYLLVRCRFAIFSSSHHLRSIRPSVHPSSLSIHTNIGVSTESRGCPQFVASSCILRTGTGTLLWRSHFAPASLQLRYGRHHDR